jgi:hypothetical protein
MAKEGADEPITSQGLSVSEQPTVARVQSLIGEAKVTEQKLSDLAIEIGRALFNLKAIGQEDGLDAVINAFGLARATAYRYLRAYESHLKDTKRRQRRPRRSL